jgi:uncharacterized membrane protein
VRRLVSYFLRGLIFVAPFAITIYVCVRIFATIDRWLGLSVPGLGFVVTVIVITLVGFLASTLLATGVLASIETMVNRLPFVRLLYSSTKDLLNAFVGEQRRFDAPVLVPLDDMGQVKGLGFVTQESLDNMGLADYVTVYLPFSYSLSGRLLLYPASRVTRLTAVSTEAMAFIVSGGVTEVPHSPGLPPSTSPANPVPPHTTASD